MYAAQGGVDGDRWVNIVAAAHITGGGIPEKVRRMLAGKGLGAHIEAVFPEPEGIERLLKLSERLPEEQRERLIDDKRACEQWNRGIGFVTVVESKGDVEKLVILGQRHNIRVAQVGETTDRKEIEFHGHTWSY